MERVLVLAEIADKMPTLSELAVISAALAVVAGVAGSNRWWIFAIVAIPVLAFFNLGQLLELRDPTFGPAVWNEMSSQYVYGTFFAVNVPFVAAAAFVAAVRSRHKAINPCRALDGGSAIGGST